MNSVVRLASKDLETYNLSDLLKLVKYYKISTNQPIQGLVDDLAKKIIDGNVQIGNFDGDEEFYPVIGIDEIDPMTLEYPVNPIIEKPEYEFDFDGEDYPQFPKGKLRTTERKALERARDPEAYAEKQRKHQELRKKQQTQRLFPRAEEFKKLLKLPKQLEDIPLELLVVALTPKSSTKVLPDYILEKVKDYDHEPYEFLGDAVLELVVTDYLYFAHQDFNRNSGEMTRQRISMVRNSNLHRIFGEICHFIITDIEGTIPGKVCADTLEAVIGILYVYMREKGMCDIIPTIKNWLVNDFNIVPDELQLEKLNRKFIQNIPSKKIATPIKSDKNLLHPVQVIDQLYKDPENKWGQPKYIELSKKSSANKTKWKIALVCPKQINCGSKYLGIGEEWLKKNAKKIAAEQALQKLKILGYSVGGHESFEQYKSSNLEKVYRK